MNNRSPAVDVFMAALDHPCGPLLQEIRMAILQAEPDLTEQIKWNAPSFGRDGVDRITFNLRPTDRVQLIFHRGSKAVHDLVPFRFHDSNGLLEKITEERGQVVFRDVSAFQAEKESLLALVHDWIAA